MPLLSPPRPSRTKVEDNRARLRAQGLRQIQTGVPNFRFPTFQAEAHRQSLAVAASEHAHEDRTFIDAISDWGDE